MRHAARVNKFILKRRGKRERGAGLVFGAPRQLPKHWLAAPLPLLGVHTITRFCVISTTESSPRTPMDVSPVLFAALKAYSVVHRGVVLTAALALMRGRLDEFEQLVCAWPRRLTNLV